MPLPPWPPPPPRASAPTPLKARAPATRSPVRDRLIDGRMITFPSLFTSSAETVDPNCLCYNADRILDLLDSNCRTSRKIWDCHTRVTASFAPVILSGKHDEKEAYPAVPGDRHNGPSRRFGGLRGRTNFLGRQARGDPDLASYRGLIDP